MFVGTPNVRHQSTAFPAFGLNMYRCKDRAEQRIIPTRLLLMGNLCLSFHSTLRHLPPFPARSPLPKASIPCVKWVQQPCRQRQPYMSMCASSNRQYHCPMNVSRWCVPEHHSSSSGQTLRKAYGQKALNMEIIQTDGYYNVFPYSIQEVTYNYLGTQTLPKENNKK